MNGEASVGIELILLAILPVVVILFFIYKKDKNKEPLGLLLSLFLSGFMSCGLVLLLSDLLGYIFPFMDPEVYKNSFLAVLLYSFIGVALVEELCKWVMVYLFGYAHNREFDELFDGIVYAIFVSLGFAFVENILYVINTAKLSTALIRAVSAVPSHACDAIFMGYYLGIAKHFHVKGNKKAEKKYLMYSIFIPALLHGIYDFCLMSQYEVLIISFIGFVVFLYTISIKKMLLLSKNNKKIVFKNKFCKSCGRPVTNEICSCGRRQV